MALKKDRKNCWLSDLFLLKHGAFTAVNRDLTKYVKLELFVMINRRYTKGIPFLSKLAYERVKGWTSRLSLPV